MNPQFLPPANEVCEGYVLTGGCLPMRGVYPIACWDTPQTPPSPGADPPAVHAGRYGQQAGGTHPTEMHTCIITHFRIRPQSFC